MAIHVVAAKSCALCDAVGLVKFQVYVENQGCYWCGWLLKQQWLGDHEDRTAPSCSLFRETSLRRRGRCTDNHDAPELQQNRVMVANYRILQASCELIGSDSHCAAAAAAVLLRALEALIHPYGNYYPSNSQWEIVGHLRYLPAPLQ